MTIETQSTEVERQAYEAKRNRERLRHYYLTKKLLANATKTTYRIPAKHLHLFRRPGLLSLVGAKS